MHLVLLPRINKMEQILHAFLNHDRSSLTLALMDDPRTRSCDQAEALITDLLNQPWNADAKEHYR